MLTLTYLNTISDDYRPFPEKRNINVSTVLLNSTWFITIVSCSVAVVSKFNLFIPEQCELGMCTGLHRNIKPEQWELGLYRPAPKH